MVGKSMYVVTLGVPGLNLKADPNLSAIIMSPVGSSMPPAYFEANLLALLGTVTDSFE